MLSHLYTNREKITWTHNLCSEFANSALNDIEEMTVRKLEKYHSFFFHFNDPPKTFFKKKNTGLIFLNHRSLSLLFHPSLLPSTTYIITCCTPTHSHTHTKKTHYLSTDAWFWLEICQGRINYWAAFQNYYLNATFPFKQKFLKKLCNL